MLLTLHLEILIALFAVQRFPEAFHSAPRANRNNLWLVSTINFLVKCQFFVELVAAEAIVCLVYVEFATNHFSSSGPGYDCPGSLAQSGNRSSSRPELGLPPANSAYSGTYLTQSRKYGLRHIPRVKLQHLMSKGSMSVLG
ncbi:hypothetical protein Cob_v006776 [Colletotrichum orbiculare MAFF 240422]|uniref:Uncharacterized protein n=1 Tax=Colletotrichum orbiculare (strain 104-T / ATCC 96160 / CBS 514.97 / LARS 414 / MAFF 240422) TaxID=1213857 RepID=A0A484FRY9_COLOR|nr:hypothetical protein Cob_v006776 [Colletotrichum orbiculare MAFF 240422]